MAVSLDIQKELLLELNVAASKVLIQKRLSGSDLIKSVEYVYRNDQFVLLANDYFNFVSTGRRPMARKIPAIDIIKWMKEKNIRPRIGQTYNSVAFAIVNSIYKSGIKGKNFINPILDITTDIIVESIEYDLSQQIEEELYNTITMTI